MAYKIEFTSSIKKDLKKLGSNAQKRIIKYLNDKVATDNPRMHGKPLSGDMLGLWSYRVGDYRIVCRIIDNKITVMVLAVGHRKNVYLK